MSTEHNSSRTLVGPLTASAMTACGGNMSSVERRFEFPECYRPSIKRHQLSVGAA